VRAAYITNDAAPGLGIGHQPSRTGTSRTIVVGNQTPSRIVLGKPTGRAYVTKLTATNSVAVLNTGH